AVPREVSRAVTVAPEMTAPEASVTAPVILALMSCPRAIEHTKNITKLLRAMRILIGRPPLPSLLNLLARCGSSYFKRCGSSLDLRLLSSPEEELRSGYRSIGSFLIA